ncbi:MAG: hypothetical protein CM15mP25_2390 [Gammaproteobacteria bacterium]|nr:MAG: hypothetical protein CM15mP25_2390 [Gammaproteobacteria bacterium]
MRWGAAGMARGVITDNHNLILDVHGMAIEDALAMEAESTTLPALSVTDCSPPDRQTFCYWVRHQA